MYSKFRILYKHVNIQGYLAYPDEFDSVDKQCVKKFFIDPEGKSTPYLSDCLPHTQILFNDKGKVEAELMRLHRADTGFLNRFNYVVDEYEEINYQTENRFK